MKKTEDRKRKKTTVNDHQQEHFKSIKKGINHNCHKNKLFIYALYNISKRIENNKQKDENEEEERKRLKMNIKVQLLINVVYINSISVEKINLLQIQTR